MKKIEEQKGKIDLLKMKIWNKLIIIKLKINKI